MTDISRMLRIHIFDTLNLVANSDIQRAYQQKAPNVDVPSELFNQWDDCYHGNEEVLKLVFNESDLAVLSAFNLVMNEAADETPQILPPLEQFIASNVWSKISDAAKQTLTKLKKNEFGKSTVPSQLKIGAHYKVVKDMETMYDSFRRNEVFLFQRQAFSLYDDATVYFFQSPENYEIKQALIPEIDKVPISDYFEEFTP